MSERNSSALTFRGVDAHVSAGMCGLAEDIIAASEDRP